MSTRSFVAAREGLYLARRPGVTIMGIRYLHLRLYDGSDLYVTRDGLPWTSQLMPGNHYEDKEWFRSSSERLRETSAVYRIRTKEIEGKALDIVLKWNRMG